MHKNESNNKTINLRSFKPCSGPHTDILFGFCLNHRKSVMNLNELGQLNGSASGAAGGEDEELPAPHELGEELKFTGR